MEKTRLALCRKQSTMLWDIFKFPCISLAKLLTIKALPRIVAALLLIVK